MIVIVALAELGLHYFPWRMVLRGNELPGVVAYIFGVLGLMLPFSVWLWEQGECEVMRVLWMVIGAGGITVMSLYFLDHHSDLVMKDKEAEEREALRKANEQGE